MSTMKINSLLFQIHSSIVSLPEENGFEDLRQAPLEFHLSLFGDPLRLFSADDPKCPCFRMASRKGLSLGRPRRAERRQTRFYPDVHRKDRTRLHKYSNRSRRGHKPSAL